MWRAGAPGGLSARTIRTARSARLTGGPQGPDVDAGQGAEHPGRAGEDWDGEEWGSGERGEAGVHLEGHDEPLRSLRGHAPRLQVAVPAGGVLYLRSGQA